MISELFSRFDRGVGKRSSMDPINDLNEDIVEKILARLPIRDAIRTSILSSKWRYKWSTLTHLVFDERCVTPANDRGVVEDNLANFITRTLLLHQGPIQKFHLSASFLWCLPNVDQWLLFLSRNDIEELVLELDERGEWFSVPSCLFNCRKLTRLELHHCDKFKPPEHFKGFSSLRSLRFHQVIDIDPKVMESFISGCPLLEDLTFSNLGIEFLRISAPNLKYLYLDGEFNDIFLENTPKLLAITASMSSLGDAAEHSKQSSDCNLVKFLGSASLLEKLVGYMYFTKYLSLGDDPKKLPVAYVHLKTIELHQVSFEDASEVVVVLHLITRSPNLRELKISGPPPQVPLPEEAYVDISKKVGADSNLPKLKSVTMTKVSGLRNEFNFIVFLLRNSPVLETFAITPCLPDPISRDDMLVELVKFQRASSQAQVLFTED